MFDSVVKALTEYPTGRTYAVACSIPIRKPWIGFEFVFTAQPDSDILGNNYGLVNQAKSLFNAGPLHLFYSSEGNYADDQSELLQVRQSLADDKRNQNWWNLTKERSQLLSQSVGNQDWQQVVLQLHEVAKIKARQIMHERLDEKLKAEANRIREAVRQAQRQDEQTAQVDMKALQLLEVLLSRWSIQLDGVGFLSINELTFPR